MWTEMKLDLECDVKLVIYELSLVVLSQLYGDWNTRSVKLWKHLVILILFAFCKKISLCTCHENSRFCDVIVMWSVTKILGSVTLS
jgi:hypothetical protein